MTVPTKEQILDALKLIHDPEIRIGIVDLGLVYDVIVEPTGKATVKMTLTTPACPYGEQLLRGVHQTVASMGGITEVEVALVWDPPWDPKEMASDHAKDILGIW